MSISQILENLGENRADFIEALADASHYLSKALLLMDPENYTTNDLIVLTRLQDACDAIDHVLSECEGDNDD